MQVERIDHINIRIPADGVAKAVAFYRDVLGFDPYKLDAYRDGERTSFFFRMGPSSLITIRPVKEFREPDDTNYDHCCLIVNAPIEDIQARLDEHDVAIERESTPLGSQGRAPAVYIRDPFGYRFELKQGL